MEGADLVLAAVAAGVRPQIVFVAAEQADELAPEIEAALAAQARAEAASSGAGAPAPMVVAVDERVAAKLTTLETAPPVMAIVPLPGRPQPQAITARLALGPVIYADGIGDPGNLGTLVRAAVVFGAAALATSPGSADLFGPKTVRSSMGAVFGLPLLPGVEIGALRAQLPAARLYGLAAHVGTPLPAADLVVPAICAIGAERAGLTEATALLADELLSIPQVASEAAESLNAGVAGAIALYEFARRRAGAVDPAAAVGGPR